MTRRARSPSTWTGPTLTSSTSWPCSWAAPAPPGAADHLMDRAPFLPGTGPYMISQYQAGLIADPGAQPELPPVVVRGTTGRLPRRDPDRPDRRPPRARSGGGGRAGGPRRWVDRRRTSPSPSGTRPGSTPASSWAPMYLFLNTRQPPFNNLEARQAINYAIDRGRLIQLCTSPPIRPPRHARSSRPTSPAIGPTAPTRPTPAMGTGTAPTWRRPRGSCRESGTTHIPVTIWTLNGSQRRGVGSYLVGLLEELGYQASLQAVSKDQFYEDARQPSPQNPDQVSEQAGWRTFPQHRLSSFPC